MSSQDLDGLGYDMRTGTRTLWAKDRVHPLQRDYPNGPHNLHVDVDGRSVIRWGYAASALFTDSELRRFHQSYGHNSVDKIMLSLQEAGFDELPESTREKMNDIARQCDAYQRNTVKPRHFSISLNWRGQTFNHVILADVVHFDDGDLVHVIDSATRLNAAKFTQSTKNPTGVEIWNAIKLCWIDVYLGPPDVLQVDQGRNFNATFVQTACAMNGIKF